MELKKDILYVTIDGAVGMRAAKFYYDTIVTVGATMQNKVWALLTHAPNYQAATPEAEKQIQKIASLLVPYGCRYDAVITSSPIGIAQLKTLRALVNNHVPLEDVLFNSLEEAEQYLRAKLDANYSRDGKPS